MEGYTTYQQMFYFSWSATGSFSVKSAKRHLKMPKQDENQLRNMP